MLWTPIPKSLSAHVIWLFSYLVKMLCGDRSFVAISVQVIWLFGRNSMWGSYLQIIGLFSYLVDILCGGPFFVATSVQVIWLFGYLVEIIC